MKAIDEFEMSDETECIKHAALMACATIHSLWQDNKDDECLSNDEIYAVKNCVQIICHAKTLNKNVIP